jgi:carboxymethylenebutenolidase
MRYSITVILAHIQHSALVGRRPLAYQSSMSTHTNILSAVWSLVSAVAIAVAPAAFDEEKATVNLPPDEAGAKSALAESARHGEWVDIEIPGAETKLHTWIVYPERSDAAPVVIVIHEIFGLTDWVRAVADQLAAQGYIAIAPDLVSGMGPDGGGTESLGETVRDIIRKLSTEETARRLNATRTYASKLPAAADKTVSIGFCWGGSASFNYAAQQPGLDGAIVYYGTAPTETEMLENVDCPVIGFYGGDDARVTSTVAETKRRMKELENEYEAHIYDGAGHGFLRQQSGRDGANQKAAEQAWRDTLAFLEKHTR